MPRRRAQRTSSHWPRRAVPHVPSENDCGSMHYDAVMTPNHPNRIALSEELMSENAENPAPRGEPGSESNSHSLPVAPPPVEGR